MKITSTKDLLVHELKDLLSAEKQLVAALPKMVKAAEHEELKSLFEEHLGQTEEQVKRLEEILEGMGASKTAEKCLGMEGLIAEAQKLIAEDMPSELKDAALIAAAQKNEHYEIAGYGTARTLAEMLDEDDAVDLLEQTLEEEKETDAKLTELAESVINVEAAEEDED